MGAQSGSGSVVTSGPASFFESSNYSGSNSSVQSREGTSSSSSSNHYEDQKEKEIYGERAMLLESKITKIYIGIEPIGTKIGHTISNGAVTSRIKRLLPIYLGGSTFTFHASCFLNLSTLETNEGVILEYGGYCGGDKSYKNYIHYAGEDGMRFSKMSLEDYKQKIHNGLKGSQIIEYLEINIFSKTLQELINECISKSKKNWRKDDYNLSSYNCQDFIAKVIEVLDVTRGYDEPTLNRHNYALSIYPPVIVKALEKNEKEYDKDLNLMVVVESIPLFGALGESLGHFIANKIIDK